MPGTAFQRALTLTAVALVCLLEPGPQARAAADADRLNYADLLQGGGSSPDPAFQSAREMRALTHLWRHLPRRPAGQAEPARPRARLTLEATLAGARVLTRVSEPYSSGGTATAFFQEATGSLIDLYGSVTGDLVHRGRVTLGAEVDPALRWTPVAGAPDLLDFRLPVLLPIRIDLPLPFIVAPLVSVQRTHTSTETLTRLEPGVAAGLFWSNRPGLAGLRASLSLPSYTARVEAAGDTAASELHSDATLRYRATLQGLQLLPLADPRYRLKLVAGAASSRDDQLAYADGTLTAQRWQTARGELRAAGEAALSRKIALGLEVFGDLGVAGPDGSFTERQLGYGIQAYLRALGAERLEVALTADLRRAESVSMTTQVGVYDVGVRWGAAVGGRF